MLTRLGVLAIASIKVAAAMQAAAAVLDPKQQLYQQQLQQWQSSFQGYWQGSSSQLLKPNQQWQVGIISSRVFLQAACGCFSQGAASSADGWGILHTLRGSLVSNIT